MTHAGAAYLPVDPQGKRLQFLVAAAQNDAEILVAAVAEEFDGLIFLRQADVCDQLDGFISRGMAVGVIIFPSMKPLD